MKNIMEFFGGSYNSFYIVNVNMYNMYGNVKITST